MPTVKIAVAHPLQVFKPGQGLPDVLATGTEVTTEQLAAIMAIVEDLGPRSKVRIIDWVGPIDAPSDRSPVATHNWVQALVTLAMGGVGGARTAYEIAVDEGFEGTISQWLLSLKGAPGQDGADGDSGVLVQDLGDGRTQVTVSDDSDFGLVDNGNGSVNITLDGDTVTIGRTDAQLMTQVTALPAAKITRFTTAQVNTKHDFDPKTKSVLFRVQGSGGPGGSARRAANGGIRCGGGGGSAGGYTEWEYPIGDLPASVYVDVGTLGVPGPATTVDDTNGTAGANSAASIVCTVAGTATAANTIAYAQGGRGGGGGTGASGAGGSSAAGKFQSLAGAAASTTGLVGAGASTNPSTPGSGGAGGGLTAANVTSAGGGGGYAAGRLSSPPPAGGAAGGGAGNPGVNPPGLGGGSGGSGGGSNATGAGGNGAAGGTGAGGGGGGASANGFASGAGGAGGLGYVEIIERFRS